MSNEDEEQVNILIDYIVIEQAIRRYMGSNLHVVLEDEGDKSVVPTKRFSNALAKVIINKLRAHGKGDYERS